MTSLDDRLYVIALVAEAVAAGARQAQACSVICLNRRTLQRWCRDGSVGDQRPARVQAPKNKLSLLERERILAVANSKEFGHMPPSQIVPILADRGQYIASESTMYRVLKAANQQRHRGAERPSQNRHKPRALSATAPAQVFSWDITYLPTAIKGVYFYLYLFMDIFSRKIVGWQVHETEGADLAGDIMRDICLREGIAPRQVVLHSDNGGPMKGATMLATLQVLGVMPSFSRSGVSNDNPYSESLFKTLKYRPCYPQHAFENLLAARQWVCGFTQWYNTEHRHSAISFVTPEQRHTGQDKGLLHKRVEVYEAAKKKHPERWSGATRNWEYIHVVYLNPEHPLGNEVEQNTATMEHKHVA